MKIACYTSFTFSYLSKARVLAESLKKYHPDWDLFALITDQLSEQFEFDINREDFDQILWSRDLDIPNFSEWIRTHNIVEACTAVKGAALLHLCHQKYDAIVYLDPDVAVFSPLADVVSFLQEGSEIVLTPHQLTPEAPDDTIAIKDNELCSLTHGVYNLGFLAISTKGEGLKFAQWWRDRLYHYCKEDISKGMFTDQRWCDLIPAFFDNVKILRDPGYNVASWNLSKRNITINNDGEILVNNSILKFFHFTKLGPVGRKMTERYAGDNTEVYEIWSWYSRQVNRNFLPGLPEKYWAYAT